MFIRGYYYVLGLFVGIVIALVMAGSYLPIWVAITIGVGGLAVSWVVENMAGDFRW